MLTTSNSARLDVHDLLARFCQYLDQGRVKEWADLFLGHATFTCDGGVVWKGIEQISRIPHLLQIEARGSRRHLMNAILIEEGANWRDLQVKAYGPVIDLDLAGAVTDYYDYSFRLRFVNRWRIFEASAKYIGSGMSEFVCGQNADVLHTAGGVDSRRSASSIWG